MQVKGQISNSDIFLNNQSKQWKLIVMTLNGNNNPNTPIFSDHKLLNNENIGLGIIFLLVLDIVQVYNLFRQLGLRHVFVVPRASRVVGMITRKDLLFEVFKLSNSFVCNIHTTEVIEKFHFCMCRTMKIQVQ